MVGNHRSPGCHTPIGRPLTAVFLGLACVGGAGLQAQERPADFVVTNATIYTADRTRPRVQALAVRDGRLLFAGSEIEARSLAGPTTEVWDLDGATVIPGMVDAHAHLVSLGTALRTVDLVGTRSYEEVIARVAEQARTMPPGEWIEGRGWDQNDWANTAMPTHEPLSRAVGGHPVYLRRVDGHAALVNAQALARAGITRETADPTGGRILRSADGTPTGVLLENSAFNLVREKIPVPSQTEMRERITLAIRTANAHGLTGIHDAGVGRDTIAIYEAMAREGAFSLRNYVMISSADPKLDSVLKNGPRLAQSERIWVRSIKISADGALGSRGAALLQPYTDDPANLGVLRAARDSVRRAAAKALAYGFQLNVHAIGDGANRQALDAFEDALRERPTADHRFRIEHAQILEPEDIPRFAELGVIPAMQGSHQTSDMYWAVERLGYARSLGAYAWRDLLDTGVIIPNGSDFPVESSNPLISFAAFITRQDREGWPPAGWFPAQRTTREEALYSVTLWPAVAAFMEEDTGSLTPGKYADFVVLDRDIMTVPPEQIYETRVVRTVLGGKTVFLATE
jgi:predicted amidohydrolase YtcJ